MIVVGASISRFSRRNQFSCQDLAGSWRERMKRLSSAQKAHNTRRIEHSFRRASAAKERRALLRRRRRRDGEALETVSVMGPDGVRMAPLRGVKRPAPRVLSLLKAFEETAAFLNEISNGIDRMINRLAETDQMNNRHTRRQRARLSTSIGNIWDFTTIDSISVPVALMLASQYDRSVQLGGQAPKAINFDKWKPEVRDLLEQVGFLELSGVLRPSAPSRIYPNGRLLRFRRGEKTDAQAIDEHFRMMGLNLFDEDPRFSEAISEAITNVVNHAYSRPKLCDHNLVPSWWLTGMVSKENGNRTVTIIVYDQGATIPKTLPYSKKYGAIVDGFRALVGLSAEPGDRRYDAEGILSAMELGRSSTGLEFRGRGLSLILETLEFCKSGHISIYSRCGAVLVRKTLTGKIEKLPVNYQNAIMGTAVIWQMTI